VLAIKQQSTTTQGIAGSIQSAADHTANASAKILSVEQAAGRSAADFGKTTDLTALVSARAA